MKNFDTVKMEGLIRNVVKTDRGILFITTDWKMALKDVEDPVYSKKYRK